MISASLVLEAQPVVAEPFRFKIAVEQDGVYRVSFDELQFEGVPPASGSLGLTVDGHKVPIWVEDGGDSVFGPGDHLEFVGQHLAGVNSYFNEFARYNVYWLASTPNGGPRMRQLEILAGSSSADANRTNVVSTVQHLERQKIRAAVRNDGGKGPASGRSGARSAESWYWRKLSHLDATSFGLDFRFGKAPGAGPMGTIRVGLTGLSEDLNAAEAEMAHHSAELKLDGQVIARAEWDGQASVVLEADDMEPHVRPGTMQRLDISIPRRTPRHAQTPLIDVVLLNWIEIEQPFDGALNNGQQALALRKGGSLIPVRDDTHALLYSADGERISLRPGPAVEGSPADSAHIYEVPVNAGGNGYLVPRAGFLAPTWVTRDRVSDYASPEHQADYLMISHASLLTGIQPLADFHRKQGLNVKVLDVEDVFDEFGGGLATPLAIRDFIRHTLRHWQTPKPRYVLLVGDASWDIFSDEPGDEYFAQLARAPGIRNRPPRVSQSLADEQIARRNLVPTLQVQAHNEFAASDNGLVSFETNNRRPELAVGRLPVADPAELTAVLGKILPYAENASVGPWRRSVALVADSTPAFQANSEKLAGRLGEAGLSASRVYPPPEAPAVAQEKQAAMIDAFDSGHLMVHFLGHGGRFVWRTAPPDFRNATDLFSVEDLPRLSASTKLPLVLSMTCSSGPFDHPRADSMAEAMLKIADRGAVSVLAASWRVPATIEFSEAIIDSLIRRRSTVGEAVLQAKRMEPKRYLVESYNLFGDPAMHLALPQMAIPVQFEIEGDRAVVSSPMDLGSFAGGKAIVDWLDSAGHTLKTDTLSLTTGRFRAHVVLHESSSVPAGALVYIWNAEEGVDGIGIASKPGTED